MTPNPSPGRPQAIEGVAHTGGCLAGQGRHYEIAKQNYQVVKQSIFECRRRFQAGFPSLMPMKEYKPLRLKRKLRREPRQGLEGARLPLMRQRRAEAGP